MKSFALSLFAIFTAQCVVRAVPAPASTPIPADQSRFTIYTLPEPLSGPCDLCTGPDGALWGQDQLVNELFRIDPKTGNIQTFTIPFTVPPVTPKNSSLPKVAGRTALSCAIRPGRDGNIYAAFGTRNQLVRINPTTKKIDLFTPTNPTQAVGDLQPFNDLYSSSTGIWFTQTTANIINFFDFQTQKITKYLNVPTPLSAPLGMFVDSAGTPWFTELLGNKIAKIDPVTNAITEYPVPLPGLVGPAVIRAETENRYIWFTAFFGNAVGRFDKHTATFKTYRNPLVGGLVAEDTVDSKGNVWFSSTTQNTLSRINATTGQIDQFVMPGTAVVSPVSTPLYFVIAINYGPGDAIWFTEETTNRVGRFALS